MVGAATAGGDEVVLKLTASEEETRVGESALDEWSAAGYRPKKAGRSMYHI